MITPGKFALGLMLCFIGGVFLGFLRPYFLIIIFIIALGVFWCFFSFFFKKKNPSFFIAVLLFGLCLIALGLSSLKTSAALPIYTAFKTSEYPSTKTNILFLQNTKYHLEKVIEKSLPYPQSALLCGLLLGNTSKMHFDLKENLNKAGIRHITAVSGMHIVILSSLLISFLLSISISRNNSFYFTLAFLWFFVLLIGATASSLRAGITGSILLFCQHTGRQNNTPRALLLALCLMLLFNPLFLTSIGFQLSFAAAFGIAFLSWPLTGLLSKIKVLDYLKVKSLLAVSISAQVFTFPLLIYHFGETSLVSPLTNILVVPILPYLMVLGFLLAIFGGILLPLSLVLLFPVWLALTYIIKIAELFAGLPFSQIALHFHWIWLVIIYNGLTIFIWQIKKRYNQLHIIP